MCLASLVMMDEKRTVGTSSHPQYKRVTLIEHYFLSQQLAALPFTATMWLQQTSYVGQIHKRPKTVWPVVAENATIRMEKLKLSDRVVGQKLTNETHNNKRGQLQIQVLIL